MNLEELLRQCRSNDPKSQRELYDLFSAKVMGLCRRYTRNKEEAQDVLQDTFIRVFQSIHQLRDSSHLEQWIRKTTVNAAINNYHKIKRHDHAEDKNGFHVFSEDHELILSSFTDSQLIQMINELPDGYRVVFNLYEIEGYSHSEIAKILRISEATSRSQLNRAKQTLRMKLKSIGVLNYEK